MNTKLITVLIAGCFLFPRIIGVPRKTSTTGVNESLENADDVDYQLDDMIFSKEQMDQMFNKTYKRNALRDKTKLWPNKTVYVYVNPANLDAQEIKIIWAALKKISSISCVNFVNTRDVVAPSAFVFVELGRNCFSNVGYTGYFYVLSLNKRCINFGNIAHEFLHALGFYHMHTSVSRDNFITIYWDNIIPHECFNFYSNAYTTTLLNTTYDYESVMQYPEEAFSRNHRNTIQAKDSKYQKLMGQRSKLSEGDITRLNRLYDC